MESYFKVYQDYRKYRKYKQKYLNLQRSMENPRDSYPRVGGANISIPSSTPPQKKKVRFAEKVTFASNLPNPETTPELRLGYYTHLDAGYLEKVANTMKKNSNLTLLSVTGKNANITELNKIAKALRNNTTIIHLGISDVTDSVLKQFAKALQTNDTLEIFFLFNSNIDYLSCRSLAKAIKTNSTLVEILLDNNKIDPRGFKKLARAIGVNKSIQEVSFSDTLIRYSGVKQLARALQVNTTLTKLKLNKNRIGKKEMKPLAEALRDKHTLTSLSFSNNHLGNTGATYLAEALQTNKGLRELSLQQNNIGNRGAIKLADSLKVNNTLSSLFLYGNKISNKGAASLANILKVNNTLSSLSLSDNKISDDGAKSFNQALLVNSTLLKLYLSENKITEKGVENIVESLKTNISIIKLDLRGNPGDNPKFTRYSNLVGPLLKKNYVGLNDRGEIVSIRCSDAEDIEDFLLQLILKSKDTLHTLDFSPTFQTIPQIIYSHIEINDDFMSKLTDFLTNNTTLTTLNLSNTIITQNTTRLLLDTIFSQDHNLAILNLSKTNISWLDVKDMTESQSLRKLDICSVLSKNWNKQVVSPGGVCETLAFIKRETPLEINLHHNNIGVNSTVEKEILLFKETHKNLSLPENIFYTMNGYRSGCEVVTEIINAIEHRIQQNKTEQPIGIVTLSADKNTYLDGIESSVADKLNQTIKTLLNSSDKQPLPDPPKTKTFRKIIPLDF